MLAHRASLSTERISKLSQFVARNGRRGAKSPSLIFRIRPETMRAISKSRWIGTSRAVEGGTVGTSVSPFDEQPLETDLVTSASCESNSPGCTDYDGHSGGWGDIKTAAAAGLAPMEKH